ncbi:MAG: imidazole glycerol phosphate synthase subunit HisH [Methanoregulaceae archaeon]|jgi:glutamine amidotransferase
MHVVIVDYGMGNLGSIFRAVSECGSHTVTISDNPGEIVSSDKLILPGVGAFAEGIKNLRDTGLDTLIAKQVLEEHKPLLGICLGMQLLATWGNEGGKIQGLDIISGEVKQLVPHSPEERIPHIGWNEVHAVRDTVLLQDIEQNSDFYFVHSYHFLPGNNADIIAVTPYCGSFVAALNHGSAWGVQFHPEKSSILGFKVLRNFLEMPGE